MSPEQAAGSKDVDGRSDLYGLGCVLYEMLSGEPPFTGSTPQAIIAKRLAEPAPRVSVVRDAVPPGVEAALSKVLARTPADRFVTAAQFAEALAHPEAMVKPLPAPKRRWWRRRAVWLGAAFLGLVVAGVAAARVFRGRRPSLDPTIVVVAPFDNQIRDTSLAQLGAITADWIAQVLQGTGEIKVVPIADVLRSWTPAARAQDLADSTGAGTVITGRVSLEGDSVYLRADVVDARKGVLLFSPPPVSAGFRKPLMAVEELARRIGGAVAEILDPAAMTSPQEVHHPTSYAAYQAFAEGVRWSYTGDWGRSWKEYQRAYALDTTFLRALIAAALMHSNANDLAGDDSLLRFVERRRNELTRIEQLGLEVDRADLAGDYQAAAAASEALAGFLPPRAALWRWGYFALLANRPSETIHAFTEVSPDFQVAARWSPGAWWLAAAYHVLGRHKEELKAAERGRQLWPKSLLPIHAELRALVALGRDEDVFRLLDEARGMEPDPHHSADGFWGGAGPWQPLEAALEFRAHGRLEPYRRAIQQALEQVRVVTTDTASIEARSGPAVVLYAAERWGEARSVYAGLHGTDTMNVDFLGGLGVSEARLGHRAEAAGLARRLSTINPPYSHGNSPYWQARIAALLGDRDRAVELLREAIAAGQVCAGNSWGDADCDCVRKMDFESLRGYPPFDDLLRPKG
jgi:TolB-like protein/tetratricopeptide (TPR) repeat protein